MRDNKALKNSDLRRIHALKREAGMDDDTYRALVGRICDQHGIKPLGEPSSTMLGVRGRWDLIKALQRAVNQRGGKHRELPENRAYPTHKGRYRSQAGGEKRWATQKQLDEIARLEDKAGWTENPDRLVGYARRVLRLTENVLPQIDKLGRKDASNLILALRNVKPGE